MSCLPFSLRSKSFVWALCTVLLGANSPASAVDNSHNPALPQFAVGSSTAMLHNSERAGRASTHHASARTAIDFCDQIAFSRALEGLKREERDAIRESSERDRLNNPSLAGRLIWATTNDTGSDDRVTLAALQEQLQAEWNTRCKAAVAKAPKTESSFTAGGSLAVGNLNLPTQSYLGFEAVGTLVQTLNVANVEEEARATAGSFDGSAHFSNTSLFGSNGVWAGVGYIRTTANASTRLMNIDPAGSRLLIPGPLGGASGFSLASAGGLNLVTQADYEAQYEWDSFYAKAGLPFDCGPWVFMPFFGVAYTDQEQTSRFSGSIPGFARTFAYNTMVDVETISPLVGFDAIRHFPGFSLHSGGLLSADFNDAHGYDRLSFTGIADSQAPLDQDDTSLGGRAWAGITFGAPQSPFKLSLDASYVYVDNIPVVTRDGTNPSSLGFESADGVLGSIRATFRF